MHTTLLFCILGLFFSECYGMKGGINIISTFHDCRLIIDILEHEQSCHYIHDQQLLDTYATCKATFEELNNNYKKALESCLRKNYSQLEEYSKSLLALHSNLYELKEQFKEAFNKE